jgi:hypothetical protein
MDKQHSLQLSEENSQRMEGVGPAWFSEVPSIQISHLRVEESEVKKCNYVSSMGEIEKSNDFMINIAVNWNNLSLG